MNYAGLYGKLPSHGDFIQRNLPSSFVGEWDQWLQHFVAGAKEKIGETWLEIYLTSPIWRFVLSHGVIDEHRWAGIVMPSVDQVGRYFPFTTALKLPAHVNPFEFAALQSQWFLQLEELALAALDGDLSADQLDEALANCAPVFATSYSANGTIAGTWDIQMDLEFEEQSVISAYPGLLDAMLSAHLGAYSVWATVGSEHVAPCLFNVQGLPSVSRLPAMLDGQWQHWGWSKPYVLNDR